MQAVLEKLPKSTMKLTIELTEEDTMKYREPVAQQLSQNMKIAGFREGKAPASIVEQTIGAEQFYAYVLEQALNASYMETIVKEKVQVTTHPKIKILSEKPLKYEAMVAVLPEVKVKDYKTINIPKEKIEIDEKDIEQAINDFRKYHAETVPADRPVQKGDRVEIDFEGTDDEGKELEGTKSTNHPIVVGEGMLLEDFESNLIGMKKDEVKSFKVTFPENYHHEPFRKKVVNFKTTMKRVEEVKLPELTEAMIEKTLGEKMSPEDLKGRIRKNMEMEQEDKNRMKREDKYIEELVKQTEIELSEMMVEEEVQYIMEELKKDLEKRKTDLKTHLERIKKTEKDLAEDMKKEAEKRLTIRMALQHLFEQEKVEVTDEDLQKEIDLIVLNFPESEREKVKKEYSTRSLRAQLKNRLMLYKLFQKVLHGE
jgi:trigger factor